MIPKLKLVDEIYEEQRTITLIAGNKAIEVSRVFFDKTSAMEFSIRFNTRQDHAGLSIVVKLPNKQEYNFQVRDNRHWDYDNDTWMKYN